MSPQNASSAVDTARTYYNSEDADNFYATIWGGEDIHVGLYESASEPIADASARTVDRMIELMPALDENSKVLDIGSGYGGACRHMAKKLPGKIVGLNLSEVENERARKLNQDQGLGDRIDIIDGSFEDLPFEDNEFDVVWSQDSILHSGNREKVLDEVARVLKSGGMFIFTDPMQADDCPSGVLQPILDRIHLESLASPGVYRQMAQRVGLEYMDFDDLSTQLPRHYSRVLQELEMHESELEGKVSADYIENMKKGLQHWIEGGDSGYLAWGILRFRKK